MPAKPVPPLALQPAQPARYRSFRDFYPFYLSEHRNRTCRRLHFIGSTIALSLMALAIATAQPIWLLGALAAGYGLAWIGHYVFEKNRPASFKQPIYSLAADWVMFRDILIGRIRF